MNWPTVKLDTVAEIIRGVTFSKNDTCDGGSDNVPILRAGNIQGTLLLSGDLVYVPRSFVAERQILKPNDIVMCMSSGSANVLGKSAILEKNWRGSFGAFLAVIRCSDKVDALFLSHFFQHSAFRHWASQSNGIGIKNIRLSDLAAFQIPFPPLEEQKRIAGLLDQADALRRLRARALEKLNTLGQAVFQDMFGTPHPEWVKVRVADVTKDARTGPFGSQLLVSEFVESGIPVLGIDNVVQNEFRWAKERFITPEKFNQLKRFQVKPSDVLVTIMGTCGRCAIVPPDIGPAINTKHICCMTVQMDQIVPEFLKASLLWDSGILMQLGVEAKGAVMPGLNMGKIANLQLHLPPLSLQNEFKAKLNLIDEQRMAAKLSLDTEEGLFASLQSAAFQGKL